VLPTTHMLSTPHSGSPEPEHLTAPQTVSGNQSEKGGPRSEACLMRRLPST
jgi:hypothetical protein